MDVGLSLMVKGMAGVFLVVGAIYLSMKVLGYLDKRASEK